MYGVEHAITTGEVPFAGPSGQGVQPTAHVTDVPTP
jgi:hypothetical protein